MLTGASGLILETVWVRAFGLILGNSLEAVSLVVGSFLAGLGLGAWLASRNADRVRRPLRAFALLELGVCGWAIVGLLVLPSLPALMGALAPVDARGLVSRPARLATAAAFLVPPTVLMGATLPILVGAFSRRSRLLPRLGGLYAANTLGAFAGVLLAGFVLLPRLGARATTLTAAAADLFVAMVAWRLGSRSDPSSGEDPEDDERASRGATEGARSLSKADAWSGRILAVLFAAAGGIVLAAEIAWTRALSLLIGGTTYTFSLVLAVFLLGAGLGSLIWLGVGHRVDRPLRAYGLLLVALGGSLLAALLVLDAAGWIFLRLYWRAAPSRPLIVASVLAISAAVVLVPALLAGLHFPLTGEIFQRGGRASGRSTGLAFLWNSAGVFAGTMVTGFWLLPALGTALTFRLLSASALVLGGLVVGASLGRPLFRIALPAIVVAACVPLVLRGPGLEGLMSMQGLYRGVDFDSVKGRSWPEFRDEMQRGLSSVRTLFAREGLRTAVRVTLDGTNLGLSVGGKPEASLADMPTQVLISEFPMILHEAPLRVLVIGYGSGITAWNVLLHRPDRLDVAEIEPAVLEASSYFRHLTGDLLGRPDTRVFVEDGRALLSYGKEEYDVIISEPSNPWMSGVNNLFTTDFYRLVRKRLRPGGLFCQWFQTYEVSRPTAMALLESMRTEFPHFLLIQGEALDTDLIAVAGRDGLPRVGPAARRRLEDPEVRRRLEAVGISSIEDFVARIVNDGASFPRTEALNTDDNGLVEFSAPWELPLFHSAREEGWQSTLVSRRPLALWGEVLGLPDPLPAPVVDRLVRAVLDRRDPILAQALRAEMGPALPAGFRDEARHVAEALARLEGGLQARDEGIELARSGRRKEAIEALRIAFAALPFNFAAASLLAELLIQEGEREEASGLLSVLLRSGEWDHRYETLCNLGYLSMADGQVDASTLRFEQARGVNPYRTEAYELGARALERQGRKDEAARLLRLGLLRAPWSQRLRRAVSSLEGAPPVALRPES